MQSKSGSIYLMIIGVCVLIPGIIFTWLLGQSYLKSKETRAWPTVDCFIIESKIGEKKISTHIPTEYAHQILYRYYWKDQPYEHNRTYRRENPWSKDISKAEAAMKEFQTHQTYTGFINPENPVEAVLAHDSKASGYSIWYPLLFVVGGLGMIGGAIRKMRSTLDSPNNKT